MNLNATAQEVQKWLQRNRFSNYVKVFQNFSGEHFVHFFFVKKALLAYTLLKLTCNVMETYMFILSILVRITICTVVDSD